LAEQFVPSSLHDSSRPPGGPDDGRVESDQGNGAGGESGAWASVSQSIWQAPAATELSFMRLHGAAQSQADVDKIKGEVEQSAHDPQQALLDATKNNRVVGIGDIHGPLGPHMALLAEEMPRLRAAGVTHLAVEIPAIFQKQIDSWQPADKAFLHDRLKDKDSIIDVIDSAKKAGVAVVGVDEFYNANGEMLASRDRTMAKNIEKILQDPQAKVAFFAGGEHLQDGFRTDSFGPSAVDLLRHKNIPVSTFFQQLSSSEDALMPIARDLTSSVSVSKADVPSIGPLKTAAGTTYDKWDNVIFYPIHDRMQGVEAELKQFGKDPGSELKQAVAANKVLLLGEMTQAEPEQIVSPQRALIGGLMPELKKAGLSDLAIDIPPGYQKSLDDFSKSGQLSGPLPDGYDRADFKAVLDAARASGLKLHAIGLQNEILTPPAEIIEKLTAASAAIADSDAKAKVLVWCREEKIAHFRDDQGQSVDVVSRLKDRGVSSEAYAGFTQDFTDWTLGLVTGVTPRPLTFDPAKTSLLRDVSNTMGMPMQMFDNVIVYPSP
jgi:hypothetical protein